MFLYRLFAVSTLDSQIQNGSRCRQTNATTIHCMTVGASSTNTSTTNATSTAAHRRAKGSMASTLLAMNADFFGLPCHRIRSPSPSIDSMPAAESNSYARSFFSYFMALCGFDNFLSIK